MKTILYATDYSDNSVAALKYAHKMREQMETRLVIVHVFEYPTVLGMEGLDEPFPHLEKDAYKLHRTKLEKFCTEHMGNAWEVPNIQLETVEDKSVLNGIIATADEWHAYLIVVGVKGESGLREVIMGSTTKHLIEKAPCPILAIPSDANYMPIKTIVYGTDFENEDIYAIRKLAEMAKQFDAEIKVIHITTVKDLARANQMEGFKNLLQQKVEYERIEFVHLVSENIFDSLRNYLRDVDADLVVLLERKKKGIFKKLFHRDLVKKMETYGNIPLLSFRGSNHQIFYFKKAL
ncbi:MAG: universal stress protein [Maribacter sp.]|nr:universal stress protein [Maribacter sp.]